MSDCYESLMKLQDAIGSLRKTGEALLIELNAGQDEAGRLREMGEELLAGLEAVRGDMWKLICRDTAVAEELARQAAAPDEPAEDPPAPENTTRQWDNKTGSFTEPDPVYVDANGQADMFGGGAGGWHDESF